MKRKSEGKLNSCASNVDEEDDDLDIFALSQQLPKSLRNKQKKVYVSLHLSDKVESHYELKILYYCLRQQNRNNCCKSLPHTCSDAATKTIGAWTALITVD